MVILEATSYPQAVIRGAGIAGLRASRPIRGSREPDGAAAPAEGD